MNKFVSICFAALSLVGIFSSISFAAYQNPTVVSNARQANGTVMITFAFAGNAGEPTVTRGYVVSQGTTATAVRNWIDDTIKELDLVRTAETLAALQIGQTVPRLARPADVPTAVRVCAEKLSDYLRVKDAGITAMAPEIAALKADIEATYVAGCMRVE